MLTFCFSCKKTKKPRWQYPASSFAPGSVMGGTGSVMGAGETAGGGGAYAPIPAMYPTPQMDYSTPPPHPIVEDMEACGKSMMNGFGPRPPGRR